MRAIILAGGSGSRLYPSTQVVSKQLLPIYSAPLLYHPLTFLMDAGITDFTIITNTENVHPFRRMLKDGKQWGINIRVIAQENPNGIAEAYILAEPYTNHEDTLLMLGDNMFYGYQDLSNDVGRFKGGCSIYGYHVKDPERYGVIEFDELGAVVSIEEKPQQPKSNYAAVGLYMTDGSVYEKARQIKPSDRGELEITDVMNLFMDEGKLKTNVLNRGVTWLDAGTTESYAEAISFVEAVEKRSGVMIACPEEVAYNMNYIGITNLIKLCDEMPNCSYKEYIKHLIEVL